jgi:outer membrane protein assembly complex protein YaeT
VAAPPSTALPQGEKPVIADDRTGAASNETTPVLPPLKTNLADWQGLPVVAVEYTGVEFDATDRLPAELPQKAGQPLDAEKVRATTRRLFATGRYRNIAVRGERHGDAVTLIFAGIPRYFMGRVEIDGVKDDRLASILEYGCKLEPGQPFTESQVDTGTAAIKDVLAQNGFYQPTVSAKVERDDPNTQVNVTYTIAEGPQARIGKVAITGKNPGITEEEFRKKGKLKPNSKVTRETTGTALGDVKNVYQKEDRLEAVATLRKSTYDPKTRTLNYEFQADQGPVVKVETDGAKFSKSRLHLLVPVFEEGAVDNDLLNEGAHNIKDYLQQQGYPDATVAVKLVGNQTTSETVLYTITKGVRHKVLSVQIKGNKYFSSSILKEGLHVQKSDAYLPSGRYSQNLITTDESTIEAVYRANGFTDVKVTAAVDDIDRARHLRADVRGIAVTYNVTEGKQHLFGSVELTGVDPARQKAVAALLNARAGQPYSLATLSGDRDAVLGFYLSNGFDQPRVEVKQQIETADPAKTDVTLRVTEGAQVFVGKMLISGMVHVHPNIVNDQLTLRAGEPLDESALLESQRNLYNLALFNQVVATTQNPSGEAEQKNAIVQLTEAKRWDVTYGFGFEAQTGTPSLGLYQTAQGTTAAQEGKAGVSPRVSLDVSRIMFEGRDQTILFHGTYGLLEEIATVTYQDPFLRGRKNLAFQLSGGYSNVQNITTFQSSTLQGDVRVTQKTSRKDTFLYDFAYRRVAVNPNSLAIAPDLIPLLSEPVEVGGPGITWFHDTRSPSPLNAQKGSYTSVQEFLASSKFGSQVTFNRLDMTNATYYTFGKRKYVLARSTRYGFIKSYGANPNASNASCAGILLTTNASCNPVPLPERLYAGGGSSFRGFPINGAGPRDLQTGYPVGGSGVFVNTTELRLPAATLPYVGQSISFVLFQDMGNVFQHVGDVFPSFVHLDQPNGQTCRVLPPAGYNPNAFGTCNFNYFSHDVGLGVRYATPVGPIRVDFSYNLNPPIYPVYSQETAVGVYAAPYVGKASNFNFFFSIGQTF